MTIKHIFVIGAGTMGNGIAQVAATSGYEVTCMDVMPAALEKAGMGAEEAEAIYRLTSLPTYQERFVIPPYSREGDIEELYDPQQRKAESGFGRSQGTKRGL